MSGSIGYSTALQAIVRGGRILIERDVNGDVEYIGVAGDKDYQTSDESFLVTRLYRDTNGKLIDARTVLGSWDDRTTLF